MTVHIDEITAEVVDSSQHHDGGGEGEARPTETQQQHSIIDLLELTQERKARLVID
jgi:hypothetical protein